MTSSVNKFIRLGLTFLFFSFVFQWEFLQMGAWVSMIRDYTLDSSFKLAVVDTFSGEKPCSKCIQLTRSQTGSSKKAEITASSTLPPEIAAPEMIHIPDLSPGESLMLFDSVLHSKQLSLRPPVPPPRFFLS